MSRSAPPVKLDDETVGTGSITVVEGTVGAGAPLTAVDVASVFGGGRATRYQLQELLGEGGNGRVYAVFDRDLGREVALKTMNGADSRQRDIFMREARVTAGLSHPNVPPVYDVGQSQDVFFLSMQRVRGASLGKLIRDASATRTTEIMTVGRLVEVLLKMCDAVAYAHARGVIHGDIKPDNVMIGEYGEVMLVDWGAARSDSLREAADGAIGTPAYMAPEQVGGAPPTPLSDIYGLGATLFHALLLRKPLLNASSDDFWDRKRAGDFDAPTLEELRRLPRALVSIALKAISYDPQLRYPSASALGEALREFQAGRRLWAAPLLIESLSDDSYRERWVSVPEDGYERSGARLLSRAPQGALLFHRQRLPAGIALEFDGEILPGERAGDLSVLWTEDDVLDPTPHWPKRGTCLSMQVAAFDNLSAGIYRDFNQCLSGRSMTLDVGRRYRVRAEIEERSLRLLLDGELIAEYEELFPLPSGYLALFSYAPGKAFSNIRLYERGVPEHVQPTAIGDAFYAQGDYESATKQYSRVEQLLPHTDLAEEARFKRGLCATHGDDAAHACAVWEGLRSEHWRARAALHAADEAFNRRRHVEVVSQLERLLMVAPSVSETVIHRWTEYVNTLCSEDMEALRLYADLRARHFAEHEQSRTAAAALEVARGNWRAVVENYSDSHIPFVEACNSLGEFQRVVDRYFSISWIRDIDLLRLGRFDSPDLDAPSRSLALALRGDLEAALGEEPCIEALMAAGRFEAVLEQPHTSPADHAAALRELGRGKEAAARGDGRALASLDVGEEALAMRTVLEERVYLLHHLVVREFIAGNRAACRRHLDAAAELPCAAFWYDLWIQRYFVVPLIERELGDDDAPERNARHVLAERPHHWFGKGAYLARFVLGEIGLEELEAQPVRLFMRGRSLFACALRAEFIGDTARACHCYSSFLALPCSERASDSPRKDPVIERWSRHRQCLPESG